MGCMVLQPFNPATVAPEQPKQQVNTCARLCTSKTLFGKKKKVMGQIFSLIICDIETSGIDGRVDKTLEPQ